MNAETESTDEPELDVASTTKVIQFLVKDEVGSLSKALQVFNVSVWSYSIKLCAIVTLQFASNFIEVN